MISKELLSEVLNITVHSLNEELGDINYEYSKKEAGYSKEDSVNIHELAHKCKEWAYYILVIETSRKYIEALIDYKHTVEIKSGKSLYQNNKYLRMLGKKPTTKSFFCETTIFDGSGATQYFIAKTEPEAIFKACQWILENKGKDD